MEANKIRENFLKFYKERGHTIIPSSSLLPEKDSSLLFVNSGMFPLVPYLLGEKHPEGKRLANCQKCFRSDDIDDIGDMRHNTFFEMLGNWSLGDYFKKEQLPWVFHFLVDVIKLDQQRLYVSVYRGNDKIKVEKDEEAVEIWKDIFKKRGLDAKVIDFAERDGMQGGRIFYYPDSENWWSRVGGPESMPVGEIGGPDSEMFYDLGEEHQHHAKSVFKDNPCHVGCDCGRFLEIGNSVFIQFIKTEEGFSILPQKNVDFGGGLERLAVATQGKISVYETDLFLPIIEKIEELSSLKYHQNIKSFEVIADHIKAATFIFGDERGVAPSNKQQGYFVRRLIRRAIRHGMKLGIEDNLWFCDIVEKVIDIYKGVYKELESNADFVYSTIKKEEEIFQKTLKKGIKEFKKLEKQKVISGKDASILYQTYGFPIELIEELAAENNQKVDKEEFEIEMQKHKNLSRELSAGVFKSGLADKSEETIKLHTATHLLLYALRKTLGSDVLQRGSNITPERLRFDFSYDKKLSDEEKKALENLVNEIIKQDLLVTKEEMNIEDALTSGAVTILNEKYPSRVLVYSIVDNSSDTVYKEVCSGPHVKRTSELGVFYIIKEEASSAGVRRIKAALK